MSKTRDEEVTERWPTADATADAPTAQDVDMDMDDFDSFVLVRAAMAAVALTVIGVVFVVAVVLVAVRGFAAVAPT